MPRQKLALTAETIRSLTPANLGTVAGGIIVVVVTTTHSIYTVCGTVSVTTTVSGGTSGSSIAQQ